MKFKIFKFKKVKSTNDTAIRIIKNSNIKKGMVTSEIQLNGRGQHGNKWISYKGNLFISFFYELKNINMSLAALAKFNCSLVKKILEKYYKKKITLKKPNDLLVDKKKISGILQEIISKSDNKFLIVGIGINLMESPKIRNYPTTNLFELINKHINRTVIEYELKVLFEKKLSKLYKIDNKLNKI